ncbi:MAG: protein kinase [Deltaproteobacteria bacterium]|nr:protein kinase [Deltaproteobacteria bacterium]
MYCPVCQSEYPADWKACPKDTTHLLPSPYIGKYRVEGLLGTGGMGAVYRAINPDTKGRVAIKVMNPAVASAESARQRFQREAAAVAALRTAHVVKVFDFGAAPDGTLFLVMELMDGHPLRDEIRPSPEYMDLARVQMVMDGALKGLAAAHRAGIVHRDLKPENVFVADTDDGEVPKLLDFGIARVRTRDSDLTRTGSLMGTASYMATEQVAAGVGEIGPWSDVYAMGAILYEMLAGAPAFGGTTVTEVLQRVLRAEITPLESVRPGLNPGVYELIARCLGAPAERPQDAEAMRRMLEQTRLVPAGTQVPPAYATRADLPRASDVGHLHTEGLGVAGRATPLPQNLTPASDRSGPVIVRVGPTQPVVGPHAFGATAPGVGSQPAIAPPVVQTGPTGSASEPARLPVGTSDVAASAQHAQTPVKKRSKVPLVLLGVALAGGGAVAVVLATRTREPAAQPPADAAVAKVTPDAAQAVEPRTPVDAAVAEVPPPDAPPEKKVTDGMIRIAAGEYEIGEAKPDNGDALRLAKATVPEFWIDRDEVTLGAVRVLLDDPKVGGVAGDMGLTPARRVTWQQASDACKAWGKRLPTEAEWEVAAKTTPNDPKKAMLLLGGKPRLIPTPHLDCSADGLCDMLGGVVEWTADGVGKNKVARGASYKVAPTAGWQASIRARALLAPAAVDDEVGFRCAFGDGVPVITNTNTPLRHGIEP